MVLKKYMMAVFVFLVLLIPQTVQAVTKEEYEEAYKIYAAAGACLAAYNDRLGKLSYEYFEDDGWEVQPYSGSTKEADARVILVKKAFPETGQVFYIFAAVGTETLKDVKVDLRFEKVYFDGKTEEEFSQNVKLKDVPGDLPKVHLGFYQYIEAISTARTVDDDGADKSLKDVLKAHPERKVYLTGHSLGGAAAIVGGAKLINLGVNPNQLEVITFGSPAVGNAAFAAKYKNVLPVTRIVISGDPVTGVLQTLVGGYKQFGKEVVWELPQTTDSGPHGIPQYLDLSMKNYLRMAEIAEAEQIIPAPLDEKASETGEKVYVAPVKNTLPRSLQGEFGYMRRLLWTEYREIFPGYFIDRGDYREVNYREAAQKGYRWLVVPEISGYRLKNKENRYYIALNQAVYDTNDGRLVKMDSLSSNTYQLTPLECSGHNTFQMSRDALKHPFWN